MKSAFMFISSIFYFLNNPIYKQSHHDFLHDGFFFDLNAQDLLDFSRHVAGFDDGFRAGVAEKLFN